MRKKLDTRFPASRIKKIMQADEDVGKIASAVPVLVSKALELFLQDLCDRTYEVTLQRGVKTMSSLHLKQCVHNCQVFDFLKDIVSKVPDLGGSDAGGDDRSLKQRITADEGNDSDEDFKQSKTQEMMAGQSSTSNSSRGRGRGRGRGRPRGSGRGGDRARYDRFEDDPETSTQHNIDNKSHDLKFSEEGLDAGQQKETLDGSSCTVGGDDSSLKRRKTADEGNDSDEDFKRSKTQEVMAGQSSTSSSSRGRGRGRGRGRPRGSGRGGVRARYDRFEDDPETSPQHNIDNQSLDLKEGLDARQQKETLDGTSSTAAGAAHNFDLNLELDENGDTSTAASTATGSATPSATATDRNEMKHEEYACWPLSDMDKMAIDPLKVSLLTNRIEEEEEDYDNEEG